MRFWLVVVFFGASLGYAQNKGKCLSGNCQNGQGVFLDSLGRRFEGRFRDGLPDGKVLFTSASGFQLEARFDYGTFRDSFYVAQKSDGTRYEGPMVRGLLRGKGKLTWKNGDVYEGEFDNDSIWGYGVYRYADGKIYEGEFIGGRWHGNGKLKLPNGDSYTGGFSQNLFDGQGEYKWKNGSQYIGDWKKGKMDGQGTLVYENGDKYVGGWKAGMRHGSGTFTPKKQGEQSLTGEWYWGEFYGQKPQPTDKENRIAARKKKIQEKKKEALKKGQKVGPQGQSKTTQQPNDISPLSPTPTLPEK